MKLDLEKYAQEMMEMQKLPPASIELPLLAVLAIISNIQLAIHHPVMQDSKFAKIAIDVARQLQQLFNQQSETYKVLELGWNPEADIPMPHPEGQPLEEFCEEPCAKFLQNLGCRCTGYHVAEVVVGDQDISPRTLAASAAMMHQIKRDLQSEQGFEFPDM